jgi:tetratricopeptide (TPR) repeat protein
VDIKALTRNKLVISAAAVVVVTAIAAGTYWLRPAARATRITREGIIAGRDGDLYRASTLLFKAAKIDPNFFLARYNLGLALKAMGKTEEALQEFYAAAIIEPADPQTYYEIARLHALAGREESSLAALERCIDLGFDNIPLLNGDKELEPVNRTRRFKDLWERWETRHQRPKPPMPVKK